MTHTKGEWKIKENKKGGSIDFWSEDKYLGNARNSDDSHEETEANALLWAAAPDMYEALKEIVKKVEDGCNIESDEILEVKIEDAKQALKKAKGENQG